MSRATRCSLRQWIWRAFFQCTLTPLILVELVLIGVYLLGNMVIRDAQLEHLQESALGGLTVAAQREAELIDRRLQEVERQVLILRSAAANALQDPRFQPDELERSRHALSADGVFYTHSDDGRSASFYSASTPVERQDHAKALRLSRLDPLMQVIEQTSPLVSAVYFNSWDNYNRIYPFLPTLERYPHGMVIPEYSFYYLADAQHNPARGAVWTDVYLDPVGQGWMMSAIAPVYRGDFLEGVVGADITLEQMLDEIGQRQLPWQGYAMLVGRDNRIMALPREQADTGRAERFDRAARTEMASLLRAMAKGDQRVQSLVLDGRRRLVAWREIPQTGWRLLLVADENEVFQSTHELADRYQQIGYLLIVGLVLFYLLFFVWMWRRSQRLSGELEAAFSGNVQMLSQLGRGDFEPTAPATRITELASMAQAIRETGRQLQFKEQERSRAQRMLELIMESTTESLWEVDTTKQQIKLSYRFAKRFNLKANLMTFEELHQYVHPDDRERLDRLRRRFFSGLDNTLDVEYRCIDREGRSFWLLARGQALERDGEGRVLRAAGTHVDISRLKQVQEDLRRATLEAQEASRAKSRFLSSMSHELRTPLNAIQGFAQLIELEVVGKSDASQEADYAREIINASRHLTALVDDILDLSSTEAQRRQLKLEPVEVGALFASCAEMILPQLREQGLQFRAMNVEPPLYVKADARRLRQILLNLLSNAIKYNRHQGRIVLGYEVRPGGVRLWVEDNGEGLDSEQQARLFQPFQRLGREGSNIPGTGIGLVLCDELAALMGGSIGFESEPGRGSRFWVDLHSSAAGEATESIDTSGVTGEGGGD